MKSVFEIEFKRYFLLTRPYSWISVAFAVFLADIFVTKSFIIQNILFDFIFAISFWVSMNLFAEKLSRDMDERGKIKIIVPAFFGLIPIIYLILFGNFISAVSFILILFSFFIYSNKNKFYFAGVFSFLFRGFMELNLFIIGLTFYGFDFFLLDWVFIGLTLYIITCARNLVGDLRDLEFDKFTFAKVVGKEFSLSVVLIFYLIPLFFFLDLIFIILLSLIFVFLLRNNCYNLHRGLVLINVFICFYLALTLIGFNLNLIVILIFAILLNLLYNFVPRKSNPWEHFLISKLF